MTDRQAIEAAISALEGQRALLGEAVVETSLAALRQQLSSPTLPEISSSSLRGERKLVTVMFADISGFTAMSEKLDPEEVRGMINACFERLGAVIDRYGGHIDKFIGDEIMALFGAPIAHENDPERCLRAALDMMAALEEFNREHGHLIPKPLALHFGINSGLVIAGGIGTSHRQDYSVMGDTVNLAARLEDLSETGEILVGEATYRLTASFFEFEAMKPVKVKGKEQSVRVYRLLKAKAVLGGQVRGIEGLSSPLVGRAEEMERLKQLLNRLQGGQGGLISVIGEAGVGKSRLINELQMVCTMDGHAEWAEGRALSYGESASYLVVRILLRNLLGVGFETPPAEVGLILHQEIEHLLPGQTAEIYPYLAHLLEVPLDGASAQRIKYLEGEALSRQILQALRGYILAKAKRAPLVLAWEDLHWADPSSLSLLETVVPLTRQCPLLLLFVYRPIRDGRVWNFHQKLADILDGSHIVIQPAPLSPAESGQLLDNLLGMALPDRVRSLIINKAEGNPFYLEEVIRSLIERGGIVRSEDNQRWVIMPDLNQIELPDTLQGVIMARIDQLDPRRKRVLQVASVIGRNFPYEVLSRVIDKVQ
jgi:class 3 adenylate cyclase